MVAKLEQISKVFSQHDLDFGRTDHVKHYIHLHDDTPFKHQAQSICPFDNETVSNYLQDLLEEGVVQESESPFSSPIAVVHKNNENVSLFIAYRKLNLHTVIDINALPNLEESFTGLSGSQ